MAEFAPTAPYLAALSHYATTVDNAQSILLMRGGYSGKGFDNTRRGMDPLCECLVILLMSAHVPCVAVYGKDGATTKKRILHRVLKAFFLSNSLANVSWDAVYS